MNEKKLKTEEKEQSEEEFLKNYNPSSYERPSVTADMLIFTVDDEITEDNKKVPEKKLKILLIRRKNHPFKGKWAIPGGFVNINESVKEAAYRELKEETNVENIYLEQLYTFGDVNRDPRMRVISIAYMALVSKSNIKAKAGDDAEDVDWFTVEREVVEKNEEERIIDIKLTSQKTNIETVYTITDKIQVTGLRKKMKTMITQKIKYEHILAFDHIKILNMALERLKNKVEYTPIAFNLVEKYFTLTELQNVYEVLLNEKLNKTAFRRKISPMVKETDKTNKGVGFRPAKYYEFNSKWLLDN